MVWVDGFHVVAFCGELSQFDLLLWTVPKSDVSLRVLSLTRNEPETAFLKIFSVGLVNEHLLATLHSHIYYADPHLFSARIFVVTQVNISLRFRWDPKLRCPWLVSLYLQ